MSVGYLKDESELRCLIKGVFFFKDLPIWLNLRLLLKWPSKLVYSNYSTVELTVNMIYLI